jgi:hypothetical protein
METVLLYPKSNVAKLKWRLVNTDLPLYTPSLSVGIKGSGKPFLRIHNFVILNYIFYYTKISRILTFSAQLFEPVSEKLCFLVI